VVIRSGSIVARDNVILANALVDIEGDTFSLTGFFQEGGAFTCNPCLPGSNPISMFWGGDTSTGSATVNGVSYPKVALGFIHFEVGGTATLPPDGPTHFTVAFPFSVRDDDFGAAGTSILGFEDSLHGGLLFALDVIGSGTAEMSVSRILSGDPTMPIHYFTESLSFSFAADDAPIPEPTSLLLLGTGLVGVIVRRARRAPTR
jgi:hypothetical protein